MSVLVPNFRYEFRCCNLFIIIYYATKSSLFDGLAVYRNDDFCVSGANQ